MKNDNNEVSETTGTMTNSDCIGSMPMLRRYISNRYIRCVCDITLIVQEAPVYVDGGKATWKSDKVRLSVDENAITVKLSYDDVRLSSDGGAITIELCDAATYEALCKYANDSGIIIALDKLPE